MSCWTSGWLGGWVDRWVEPSVAAHRAGRYYAYGVRSAASRCRSPLSRYRSGGAMRLTATSQCKAPLPAGTRTPPRAPNHCHEKVHMGMMHQRQHIGRRVEYDADGGHRECRWRQVREKVEASDLDFYIPNKSLQYFDMGAPSGCFFHSFLRERSTLVINNACSISVLYHLCHWLATTPCAA